MRFVLVIATVILVRISVRHPAVVFVLIVSFRDFGAAAAIVLAAIALVFCEVIWETALCHKDLAAIYHLANIVKKSNKVAIFNLNQYEPTLKTGNSYDILNIDGYETYAAIQYKDRSSFVITTFSPDSERNAMRMFWLLHECSHIGGRNRRASLHLETGKYLSMGLMTPAIALAFPGLWLVLPFGIIGGFLVALSMLNGRLESEVEADLSALQLAANVKALNYILNYSHLAPPSDRKLKNEEHVLRSKIFARALKDVRLDKENFTLSKEIYMQEISIFRRVGYGVPLFVFIVVSAMFVDVVRVENWWIGILLLLPTIPYLICLKYILNNEIGHLKSLIKVKSI